MFKKFAFALALLVPMGCIAFIGFNSSTIDPICRIFANCRSFKQPYDTALILNRDAKTGLTNSQNIDDLRRVYQLAEKSSNTIALARIPDKYLGAISLNNSNKELLDKVGYRINQEEKAKIYLKQAQEKVVEADKLATAYLGRSLKYMQRMNDESAAFLAKLERESLEFRIKQANQNTGSNLSLPSPTIPISEAQTPQAPEKDISKEEEKKQQTIEYTKALILYKESLELLESIHPDSFVNNEKVLLLKASKDKIASKQKFINTYLNQSKK